MALTVLACAVPMQGAAAPSAPGLTVTAGPVGYQVLQRSTAGTASIPVAGTAPQADGKSVEARLLRKGVLVPNFDWKPVSRVRGASWNGAIEAVPTGGPYRIEFRVSGQATATSIDNILVGDLWILAGQSNMQGVGNLVNVTPSQEMVHSFELNDSWRVAQDPLHNYADAADPVHWKLPSLSLSKPMEGQELAKYRQRTVGAGLGMPFAAAMVERTGVPIGLIPCAHGGTSMGQWSPTDASKGGESLYGSMLRRFKVAGGRVAGVLWYQGESDVSPDASKALGAKFQAFVAAVRHDFGQPTLPFYYVQIGRFVNPGGDADWNRVQEAQLQSEVKIGPGGMATSVDLALEDAIHLDTASQKRLGVRLANLVCHDLFPNVQEFQGVQRGPRPVSAVIRGYSVRVNFSQVNGALRAGGRIAGFSVHSATGEALPVIIKAEFAPDGKSIVISLNPFNLPDHKFPPDMTLHYGYGKDPYCNVTDALDMALPAFGPLPIQIPAP